MVFRPRHRRCIALIALLGLLFQQLALASYLCPIELGERESAVMQQPCDGSDVTDRLQCSQHCASVTPSADHPDPLTVPAAVLPATTWLRGVEPIIVVAPTRATARLEARSTSPPLTIQHCSFQI